MNLPRITQHQADAGAKMKAENKPLRHIERVLGLTYGVLSGRYTVGDDARPIMDHENNGPSGWRYPTPPESKS